MRANYLFEFARTLHISPSEVDALRFWDFIGLVIGLEKLIESAKSSGSN